jgi:hypothetical protein
MPSTGPRRSASVSDAYPPRKLSETILDFGAPLIERLGGDSPLALVYDTYDFVIDVWNAHVLALPMWGHPEVLAAIQQASLRPDAPPEMREMLARLAERRRARFAHDARPVADWNIKLLKNGKLNLHCDFLPRPSAAPTA